MLRPMTLALCVLLTAPLVPSAASAQTGPMPLTEVTKDDFLIALAGARIRLQYEGITLAFLNEMQDRDVGQLFSYGAVPPGRTIDETEVVVATFDGWAAAQAYYAERGFPDLAEVMPPAGDENVGGYVNVSTLQTDEGRAVRFYTFVRRVNGVEQDQRCMARLVIDDIYAGNSSGTFDSTLCSDEIE